MSFADHQRQLRMKATDDTVAKIVVAIGERFRTFGGDRDPGNNPVAHAHKGKPLAFAAMVDVEEVVRFVLDSARTNG